MRKLLKRQVSYPNHFFLNDTARRKNANFQKNIYIFFSPVGYISKLIKVHTHSRAFKIKIIYLTGHYYSLLKIDL